METSKNLLQFQHSLSITLLSSPVISAISSTEKPFRSILRALSNFSSARPSAKPFSLAFFSAVSSTFFQSRYTFKLSSYSSYCFLVVAFLSLLTNRKCRIEHASIFKELLLGFLHLYQNSFAFLVLAIHIKHSTPVRLRGSQMFRIKISKFLYNLLTIKKTVYKTD